MKTAIEHVETATRKFAEKSVKALFRKACLHLSGLERPVFVKVGANDGVTNDLCADILIENRNWSGVLIEPVPFCFERLKANFGEDRFILENVAIGAGPAIAPFYYLSPVARKVHGLPAWVEMLGSFRREHLVASLNRPLPKHLKGILDEFIVEHEVMVDTLGSVLSRHGIGSISLLHVDTEGHDWEVLKSLGEYPSPPVIFVEHEHVGTADKEEMAGRLLDQYTVFDSGSDYLAIHKELELD